MNREVNLDNLVVQQNLTGMMYMYDYYWPIWILCVDGGIAYVRTEAGIFEVDLGTSVSKRICDSNQIQKFLPYKSFYRPQGFGAGDGQNGFGAGDGQNGQN
ncbi:hypothetical protein ACP70R_019815 [Stipagrostis hirtigluma subsp. patula]